MDKRVKLIVRESRRTNRLNVCIIIEAIKYDRITYTYGYCRQVTKVAGIDTDAKLISLLINADSYLIFKAKGELL